MIANNRYVVGNFPTVGNPTHEALLSAKEALYGGTCLGAEMLGWLDWPKKYLESPEYSRLKEVATEIQNKSSAVVVVGIGGSYLTPQMVIHSLYGTHYNEFASKYGLPKLYFEGCDLSPVKLGRTLELLADEEWSIVYISKSGGTMEPALIFRILWDALVDLYGPDEANSRVYAVTDSKKGILKGLADEHKWESFVIPDDIGGRFSGLTAVGLLPLAIAGIPTDQLLEGAICAMNDCKDNPGNFAEQFSEWRYENTKENLLPMEFFAMNTPDMIYASEWLKQLFGESEGKDGFGIFPTSGVFPTDLHSLGQFLQEGSRFLLFEDFICRKFETEIEIPESDLKDNLDAFVGKTLSQANAAAMDGAYKAHSNGDSGNPCALIEVDSSLDALGALMYYAFITTSLVAIMTGVNPYNQPGVEFHKSEMKSSPKWDSK